MAWDIGAFEYGAAPVEVPAPTTPPTTVPPVTPPVSGTGTSPALPSQGPSIRQTGGATFILGRVYLDTGTEYEASRVVVAPDWTYEGRVLEWGYVDRSIPVPSGIPQLGDCRIKLADTDRKFRDLVSTQTPRRRLIELRIVAEGESESAVDPFATFEIVDMEFPAGAVEISGRDINFTWIDKPIPGLINRTNFPDLMDGVDEAFLPIIAGVLDAPSDASPPNPQGVLTLPRMTATRWGLAQHPIIFVDLCSRVANEDEFQQIDTADYVITEEPTTINGIGYTLSFVDFLVEQDPAMEVRCRFVEGFYTRGQFGDMPPRQNSPLQALRNPIDLLINILYEVIQTEPRIPRFNTASFLAVQAIFDSGIITTESPADPYACDGAIVEPITVREFLAQFLTSFELDMYVNRFGEIEVNVTMEEDPDRPVFSDGPVFDPTSTNSLILINSVRQRLANPTCNRLRYNYAFNYATKQFAGKDVFDNTDDQIALGGIGSPPIPEVEEDTVDFMWVREVPVAGDVARRRMEFLALGSYRIELQMPLPEVFDDLELAKLIGVTHYGGLEVGGYFNTEFKTTGLTYDLDRLLCTLRGIRRTPVSMEPPDECPGITGPAVLDFGDSEVFNAPAVDFTSPSQVYYDPNDYPGMTSIRFRAVVTTGTSNPADFPPSPSFEIVDELGTVYASISPTLAISPSFDYEARIDQAVTLSTTAAHSYFIKSNSGLVFQLLVPQIWIFLEESDQAKFQIPLLMGTEYDGDGGYFTSSTSYIVPPGASLEAAIFKKTAAAFDEIDFWEVRVLADRNTKAGAIALFNKTTNTKVAATELTIATGDAVNSVLYSATFSDTATDFTDGDDFEFRIKRTAGSGTVAVLNGSVFAKIGSGATGYLTAPNLCANDAEVYVRASVSDCQDNYLVRSYQYNSADWPSTAVKYFEASDGGSYQFYLLDTGTSGTPIDPPSNVTFVTLTGSSRQRSSSISLTNQHIYAVGGSMAPFFDVPGWVLHTISGP